MDLGVVAAFVFFCLIHYLLPFLHAICVVSSLEGRLDEKYKANIPCIINYPLGLSGNRALSRVLSMDYTVLAHAWIIHFVVTAGVLPEEIYQSFRLFIALGYCHLPFLILFLWVDTFHSWEYQCLSHQMEENVCKEYIQDLRRQWPVLTLTVVASSDEGECKKSIDDIEHVKFPFTYWEDLSRSPNTLILDPNKVTRVKLQKRIILGDRRTLAKYYHLQGEMEAKLGTLNPYSCIQFEVNPGDEEKICVFPGVGRKRWWTDKRLYIILSLFLMTWIYRIAFRFATQSKCFKVVKRVYYIDETQNSVALTNNETKS